MTIVIRNFLCCGYWFTTRKAIKIPHELDLSCKKKIFAHSIDLSIFVRFPLFNEFLEQRQHPWEPVLIENKLIRFLVNLNSLTLLDIKLKLIAGITYIYIKLGYIYPWEFSYESRKTHFEENLILWNYKRHV